MEGHEPTTRDYNRTGMKVVQSMEDFSGARADDSEDPALAEEKTDEVNTTIASDRSFINRSRALTVEDATDRFRHLLLYGRKKVNNKGISFIFHFIIYFFPS